MSSRTSEASASHDDDETAQDTTNDDLAERQVTRRRALGMGVGAAVALGTAGTASAQETETEGQEITVNWGSDFAHDAWINGTVTVEEHLGDFSEFDYIADDGERANLEDDGFALAREPDDDSTPHNPVSLAAADFYRTADDGDRERLDEYAAFPRGVTYDDGDGDDEEAAVSALDATHWSVDNSSTSGTLSVTDGANGSLDVSIDSQASGDVARATLDLSSVGSTDATITSGVARKFLQTVFDADTLPAGALVEFAVGDSTGGEVVASIDPSGDTSTEAVLSSGTGDSQVGQARVGELGTIEDIQTLTIRVKDAAASITLHGLNLERESEWVFGQREETTTDDDGNTIVETVDVVSPAGQYSVTSLDSLNGTPFGGVSIAEVVYDVEMRASELPDAQVMARVKDTPDTYSKPKEAEVVAIFDSPSAYALGVSFENFLAEVALPSGRYVGAEVATGIAEIEDWNDVENVSWTSRTEAYDSVGKEVELLSSVTASDRSATRHRYLLDEDEVDALTASSGSSAVVMASGDGGGLGGQINMFLSVALGLLGGLGVWFRKDILGALSG